ncbi:MAG TPA: GNAT family N-acetyltransferase [Alphaproteobacteria bacterium]|nr:GNAT family N-acetyltransferase [Alphaproteobacteria bacterium]
MTSRGQPIMPDCAPPDLAMLAAEPEFDFASVEYRAFFARAKASPFQHPDWLAPFYRRLARPPAIEPLVVVGRDAAGGLALVVPMLRRTGPAVGIEFAFLGVTDYALPVVAPELDLRKVPHLSARFLAALGRHDTLHVAPVRQQDAPPWRELLGAAPETLGFGAHDLACDGDYDGCRNRIFAGAKASALDRKIRRLAARGGLRLERLAGAEIGAALAAARRFRQGRFKDDPMQRDDFHRFYTEVAERGAESGLARTYRLSSGGGTVAVLFGLIDGERFCYLVLGCDYASFGKFSPGMIMFDYAMRDWFGNGGAVFDFTIGDEAFKTALGCRRTAMLGFRRDGAAA